ADDDEIDAVEPGGDARKVRDRPEVRVELQRLAQADVDAREALTDGRRDRTLQRDAVSADRVDERGRERLACALKCDHARVVALPVDRHAGGAENADDRRRHLGPDAVAGNERDGVGPSGILRRRAHSRTYQYSSTRPSTMLAVISIVDRECRRSNRTRR